MTTPRAYYNDSDETAARWLRGLIGDGWIPEGDVDDRPIERVTAADLRGYTQCHFFAGIGGWPYALRLAAWPDDRPVWSGSCPCQPFSSAGKNQGFEDRRHLWPSWRALIAECRPAEVFGEQIAAPAGLGWFDHVAADLETLAYAVGAADLPAAGVGAPHRRQRLFWLATLGDAARNRQQRRRIAKHGKQQSTPGVQLDGPDPRRRWEGPIDVWVNAEPWVAPDGRRYLTEPDLCPLAHGVPGTVERLRGYGNAIVPQVAAAFIAAYLGDAPVVHAIDCDLDEYCTCGAYDEGEASSRE